MTRHLFTLLFSTLGSLLLTAATAFLLRLVQQAGSLATRERATTLGSLAADAIAYTAEISATWAKQHKSGLTSSQKLSMAIEYMLRQTRLSREEAADHIHSTLSSLGEGASK